MPKFKDIKGPLSIDEDNRALTSCQLATSLLSQARGQAKSTLLRKWMFLGDADDWSLGHNNPTKSYREISHLGQSQGLFWRQLRLDAMSHGAQPPSFILFGCLHAGTSFYIISFPYPVT